MNPVRGLADYHSQGTRKHHDDVVAHSNPICRSPRPPQTTPAQCKRSYRNCPSVAHGLSAFARGSPDRNLAFFVTWVPITILDGSASCRWRMAVRFVGHLLSYGHRTPLDLAGQLGHDMWGRQRFRTLDDSRNSLWVALLTFGEGWHNNHHAYPQSARHGMAWYEVDLNWYGICVLRLIGLAWGVKVQKPQFSKLTNRQRSSFRLQSYSLRES